MTSQPAVRGRWPHRLSLVTCAATLLLIFVGGLVTNTGSGLAVPDWPTTFGHNMFLYPWSQMVGGIFYEHSHRLIGSAVGMLTVALALCLWFTDERRWIRVLGLCAVAAVIIQGILGGLRVVLLEHGLAIVHGCFAQLFLALMVTLAVCTSPWWMAAPVHTVRNPTLRMLGIVISPLIYLQVVFGALVTHTGSRLDAHLVFATLVAICVVLIGRQVTGQAAQERALLRPTMTLMVLLALQLVLGFLAYVRRFTVLGASLPLGLSLSLPTTHRLVGAMMLATSVVLTLRILRLHAAPQGETAAVAPHTVPLRRKEVPA